jgi:hypothetical protein
VRAGVDGSQEVYLSVLVLNWRLVVALVEGAAAVHDHDLNSVCEHRFSGVNDKEASVMPP